MFPEAALVDGPDLLQEDHGILGKAHAAPCNIDVGGKPCLPGLAGDGGGNDRGGMPVAGIVLDDEHRSGAALLAAHHRGQVRVKDVAPFDQAVHMVSHSVRHFFSALRSEGLCNAVRSILPPASRFYTALPSDTMLPVPTRFENFGRPSTGTAVLCRICRLWRGSPLRPARYPAAGHPPGSCRQWRAGCHRPPGRRR